jgi:hypothetical protein
MKALFVAGMLILSAFFLPGCTDEEIQNMITSGIAEEIAVKSGDPARCANLDKSVISDCYSQMAENKKDLSLCDKIVDKYGKQGCIYNVALAMNDAAACAKLTDQTSNGLCTAKVALTKKDPGLCKGIPGDLEKANCYSDIATVTGDKSLCNNLQGQSVPYCQRIVAVKNGKPQDCYLMDAPQTEKDDCALNAAATAKDPAFCGSLANQETKDYCYERVAMTSGQATICTEMADKSRRESCYSYVAQSSNNTNACQRITEMTKEYECVRQTAINARDASLCLALDAQYRTSCYREAATQLGSHAQCGKIKDEIDRKACQDAADAGYG